MDILDNLSKWLGGGMDGVSNMFEKRFPGQTPASSPSPRGADRGGWGGFPGGDAKMNSRRAPSSDQESGGLGGRGGLLGSSVLGGLAGALLGGRNRNAGGGMGGGGGLGGLLTGALLGGGGKMLWDKYKQRIQEANEDKRPDYGTTAAPRDQAARLIRALVYAAKADGHIDDNERAAINEQIRQLNIGDDGQRLVNQAMNEPLNPSLIANGVKSADEALQLFAISCAVVNVDNFMERSYLDALAKTLGIPDDVRTDMESRAKGAATP